MRRQHLACDFKKGNLTIHYLLTNIRSHERAPALLLRVLLLGICTFSTQVAIADSAAFVNVNVIAMNDDSVIRAQTVIVNGDRIVAIGDVEVTVLPGDAQIIDGTDRYLLPGLTEMHGHVTSTTADSLDSVLGLFVANGVTTVRGMLGRPSHLKLRQRIIDQDVLGPRLITSGPSFNGDSVDSPEQAVEMVKAQFEAGYDFLKIHPGLTHLEFMAIADAANELGIPFAGHVPSDVGVPDALSAGISSIDHLDGFMQTLISPHEDPTGGVGGFFGLLLAADADESRIRKIAEETAAAGVRVVPTEALFEHTVNGVSPEDIGNWSEMKYVSRSTVNQWVNQKRELINDPEVSPELRMRAIELRRQIILELHRAGAGLLLLGSDSPQRFNVPGFALHRELEYLVAAGLSPFDALRTGTVNPAVFFAAEVDAGTIEVGKIADLVLLDQNPFEDIKNIRRVHGTMLRGRWVNRPEIDAILARAERN
jgi:imidazolonepropionase-like amidohydrolase